MRILLATPTGAARASGLEDSVFTMGVPARVVRQR